MDFVLRKPEVAIRPFRDNHRATIMGRNRELGHLDVTVPVFVSGIDTRDLVGVILRKPEVPIVVRGHIDRFTARGRNGKLGDFPRFGIKASDFKGETLGKPKIPIAPKRDPGWTADGGWNAVFGVRLHGCICYQGGGAQQQCERRQENPEQALSERARVVSSEIEHTTPPGIL